MIVPLIHSMPWTLMDRKYWIVFVILIVIMLYAIISYQWLMGVIACIVVILLAWILSHVEHWGRSST